MIKKNKIQNIAIHLPQFHPFEENDEWWGKGFTEWTNVTKANPRFKGHYQPHLPSDLGFYDLRLEETRIAQAELAKAHGIDGFCYYHYWFNGKRLLHRPLDDMLKTQTPDFPFMLCWANENWSRRWDGQDHEVLIKQEYNFNDDRSHIQFLIKHYFSDHRYIKVEDKPFIAIYRPSLFPDIKTTVNIWREEAQLAGLKGLYIGYFQSNGYQEDPVNINMDCAIEFLPHTYGVETIKPNSWEKIKNSIGFKRKWSNQMRVCDYRQLITNVLENIKFKNNVFPGITPSWDNSARRKKDPFVLIEATPDNYGIWLFNLLKRYRNTDYKNKFVFINAWNEWAEGNHLEPCQKWGRQYLETTKEIVENLDNINYSPQKWEYIPFKPKEILLDKILSQLNHLYRKAYFIIKAIVSKIKKIV